MKRKQVKSLYLPPRLEERIKATQPHWIANDSAWIRKLISDQLDFIETRGQPKPSAIALARKQPSFSQPETFQDETISYDPEFNQA